MPDRATVHQIKAAFPEIVESWRLRACGGRTVHVDDIDLATPGWRPWGDVCAPNHDPAPGERYFRDGLPAEARAIMRARIEAYRASVAAGATAPGGIKLPPLSDEACAEMMRQAGDPFPPSAEDHIGDGRYVSRDFAPGWPILVVRGTDADMLPVRKQ